MGLKKPVGELLTTALSISGKKQNVTASHVTGESSFSCGVEIIMDTTYNAVESAKVNSDSILSITVDDSKIVNAIGLTADKIVSGNTILGVAGTGGGNENIDLKLLTLGHFYSAETFTNQDIPNKILMLMIGTTSGSINECITARIKNNSTLEIIQSNYSSVAIRTFSYDNTTKTINIDCKNSDSINYLTLTVIGTD